MRIWGLGDPLAKLHCVSGRVRVWIQIFWFGIWGFSPSTLDVIDTSKSLPWRRELQMHCRACERFEKLFSFSFNVHLRPVDWFSLHICFLQGAVMLIAQTEAENMAGIPAGLWAVGEVSPGLRNWLSAHPGEDCGPESVFQSRGWYWFYVISIKEVK